MSNTKIRFDDVPSSSSSSSSHTKQSRSSGDGNSASDENNAYSNTSPYNGNGDDEDYNDYMNKIKETTTDSAANNNKNNNNSIEDEKRISKYAHGSLHFSTNKFKHKALRKTLENLKTNLRQNATATSNTELLLSQDEGFIQVENNEKIYKIKQKDIQNNINLNSSKNLYDFQLTKFGPYNINFSRNGRFLVLGGKKGHVATLDCLRTNIGSELQLQEDVHSVTYLHNESIFAAAQKQYTYIYDHNGVELHCLRKHEKPYALDFLPYHYLLTSIGQSGWIKWHDVSIGQYIAGYATGHGSCKVLRHNPHNAVSVCGHSNGVVSLWSPSSQKALVSMFSHKSPVTDVAVDREGRYLTTAGLDGLLKIWDIRNFQVLHTYKTDAPVLSIDVSDRNLIAIGVGRNVQVLKNAFTTPMDITYLKHEIRTPNRQLCAGAGAVSHIKSLLSSVRVHSVRFRPYEDSLCIGHSHGITSIIVPGSGEANYDSFEANPFSNQNQRREEEVQKLLNKLAPEMIELDAEFIATVDKDATELHKEQQALFYDANKSMMGSSAEKKQARKKMRGRNKIGNKLKTKMKNVIEEQQEKQTAAKLTRQQAADEAERQEKKNQQKLNKMMNKKSKLNHNNIDSHTSSSSSSSSSADIDSSATSVYDPLNRFTKNNNSSSSNSDSSKSRNNY